MAEKGRTVFAPPLGMVTQLRWWTGTDDAGALQVCTCCSMCGDTSCLNSSQIFSWQNHLLEIIFKLMVWTNLGMFSRDGRRQVQVVKQFYSAWQIFLKVPGHPEMLIEKATGMLFKENQSNTSSLPCCSKVPELFLFSICRNQQYRNWMQTSSTHKNKYKWSTFGI